jgi:glycosyltransferase involved in cell wall biosynthesis
MESQKSCIKIPVIVSAHNEEVSIARCLTALIQAIDFAEQSLSIQFVVIVGADRCTDRTVEIATSFGVDVQITSGGKVATQKSCIREAPFLIFSDADVYISKETIYELCQIMLAQSHVFVAFPPKKPLPFRRKTYVSRSAHDYTRDEGFQQQRTWFDGKFFVIRTFSIPTIEELRPRFEKLHDDRFYTLHKGLTIDDIYLSRWTVHHHGVSALHQTTKGLLSFRSPETIRGMYSYYRRIRRELERVDLLFPEMKITGKQFGYRRTDWRKFFAASLQEQSSFLIFQLIDHSFGPIYWMERWYYQYLAKHDCNAWPVIPETKG